MKIAVVGGGSSYTPELMEGLLARRAALSIDSVVLHDVDAARLDVVGGFCVRMAAAAGAPGGTVRTTLDLGDAIDGASFVLNQVRVGGQEARHQDITVCLEAGLIGQETTGIGGFAKAMRTIPVVLDLCRAMERRCPGAWLLNFTNPSGLVTEAIARHSAVQALGLCNIPIDAVMALAAHLGVEPRSIELDYVGLNHLSWIRRVLVGGADRTGEVLEALAGGAPANLPDLIDPPWLVRAVGGFPLYYLRFYYHTEKMLEILRGRDRSRAEEVLEIERRLFELYRDPARTEKPAELSERGGAYYSLVAIDLVEAIATDSGAVHVVNLPHAGAVPNLDDDWVLELPAAIGRERATPVPTAPMVEAQRGLLTAVKEFELLTVRAAVEGSREAALAALLVHPLGPGADAAPALLDRIVAKDRLTLT